MRTTVLFVLLAAAALPLAGQAGPAVSPSEISLRAGDHAVLHGYQHPGGLSTGFPYHYQFFSDDMNVANVHGFASGRSYVQPDPIPMNGDIFVEALQPGVAHIVVRGLRGARATITVLPPLHSVEIVTPRTTVTRGRPVTLTAIIPGYDKPPSCFWYQGRIGDTAHPLLGLSDPVVTIVPTDLGPSFYWVQAFADLHASSAEIALDVVPPRRRLSGR